MQLAGGVQQGVVFLWGDSGATRFERRFGIDKRDCQRTVVEFAGRVADCHIGVGKRSPSR